MSGPLRKGVVYSCFLLRSLRPSRALRREGPSLGALSRYVHLPSFHDAQSAQHRQIMQHTVPTVQAGAVLSSALAPRGVAGHFRSEERLVSSERYAGRLTCRNCHAHAVNAGCHRLGHPRHTHLPRSRNTIDSIGRSSCATALRTASHGKWPKTRNCWSSGSGSP